MTSKEFAQLTRAEQLARFEAYKKTAQSRTLNRFIFYRHFVVSFHVLREENDHVTSGLFLWFIRYIF